MKKTLLALVPAAFLVSCSNPQPEEPAAPAAAPEGNPYGVPDGNLPNYDPNAAAYQPIQPINPGGTVPGAAPTLPGNPTNPVAPANPGLPAPVASNHVVVAGDSLWGLSRKYNVTVEALQQANGLTGTQINVGQSLAIPAAR